MSGSRMMIKPLLIVAMLGAGVPVVHADARLVYDVTTEVGEDAAKTLSVARFFVRVESSDQAGEYLLFQAGKFFPLFRVDVQNRTYTPLTPPVQPRLGPADRGAGRQEAATETRPPSAPPAAAARPESAAPASAAASLAVGAATPPGPRLQPTERMETIADVRCRVVMELVDGEPGIEHCMANKAALGITERETRTLARLFEMARKRGWDWLPAATGDEEFVSVRSRRAADVAAWTLRSVSTAALPADYMRISRDFRELPYQPLAETPAAGDLTGSAASTSAGQNDAPAPAASAESKGIEEQTQAD